MRSYRVLLFAVLLCIVSIFLYYCLLTPRFVNEFSHIRSNESVINSSSHHQQQRRHLAIRCRVLRGFDDAVDDVKRDDGYHGDEKDGVTSSYNELEFIEACYRVRPVLMSSKFVVKNMSNSVSFLVPDIVHYIHFRPLNMSTLKPIPPQSVSPMSFLHHVSYLSVHRFLRPRYIFIHGDVIPHGTWWHRTLTDVDNIFYVNASGAPTHVYGRRITIPEHRSDILRYQLIYELGGIYLDPDVLVLRSFDPLRNYWLTLGRQGQGQSLANGIIIGRPGAVFIRLWITTYKTYNPHEWSQHSVIVPAQLHQLMPHLLHVEEDTLINPTTRSLLGSMGNIYTTGHVNTRVTSGRDLSLRKYLNEQTTSND